MDQDELIAYIKGLIAADYGSQQEFAERCGLSAAYVSDVLNKRRLPGQKILDAIGCDRVTVYQLKGKA